MLFRLRRSAVLVFLASFPLSGCLFRTHKVQQELAPVALKTATKAELVDYINTEAGKINTMQATVDIDTAVGGAKKGKVIEYEQIRGYVLARKPAMLRMIGLMPFIRSRAFDMVSDGREFKLYIAPKNRFVIGQNNVATPNPQQPLENLRPKVIYDALLLREIAPDERPVLGKESETITGDKGRHYQQPNYVIFVIRSQGENNWVLSRKIYFSRIDLLPNRQEIFDETGTVVTDARYSNYKDNGGLQFPSKIEIRRPEEEYDITLTIVKLVLNDPLSDDKFVLQQPPGTQVIHLDQNQLTPNGGGSH
jgi:outer membrane lipoprotein-sorting protein